MPAFNYIGRDSTGAQIKGSLDGSDEHAIAEQLSRQRIIPISIEAKKSSNNPKCWRY